MAKLFLFSSLALAAAKVQVRLNVLSGSTDPEWLLTEAQEKTIVDLDLTQLPLADDTSVARPFPAHKMGYRGFEVIVDDKPAVAVYNKALLETELLITAVDIPRSVAMHVADEIARVYALTKGKTLPRQVVASAKPQDCTAPVVGSDNMTAYGPDTDVCGFFLSHQSENNCYDYGNDIATNTFAQPGRGTGTKWTENTCDNMRAAAERDGLVWAGTDLPAENPSMGHYLALLIWPNTNFHWIRKDDTPDGFWSHKPGGTAARDVDDDNKKITDPSMSNFSPWTEFCGYMTSVPSNVTIN